MAVPTLTLTDSESNVYTFPPDFWLSGETVSTSKTIANRTYAAGGKNIADGFLEAKTLTLEGALRADTLALLETRRRNLMSALLKGGQLRLSDDTVSRYIDVIAPDLDIPRGDYRHEIIVNITLIAENPFWVDSSLTSVENIVAGDTTIYVNAAGSDFVVSPTITIENDQGVDNPGVKMINRSDGSMSFIYNDTAFQTDDILVINCEEGTVQKNNNNAIENMVVPARFLRLWPLSNEIGYEGSACTITFSFRKAYL